MALVSLQSQGANQYVLTAVFRAVDQVLRDDPTFSKITKTMRSWRGDPGDALPPASPAECPWCRITPVRSPMKYGDETGWWCDFVVRYEMVVAGTNYDDLTDYFGTLTAALNFQAETQATTALAYLRTAGATVYEIQQAALGPLRVTSADPQAAGTATPQYLGGTGNLSIRVFIKK